MLNEMDLIILQRLKEVCSYKNAGLLQNSVFILTGTYNIATLLKSDSEQCYIFIIHPQSSHNLGMEVGLNFINKKRIIS